MSEGREYKKGLLSPKVFDSSPTTSCLTSSNSYFSAVTPLIPTVLPLATMKLSTIAAVASVAYAAPVEKRQAAITDAGMSVP
jgi:hypothetical protein